MLTAALSALAQERVKPSAPTLEPPEAMNLVEVCAMVRGLTDDVDFGRSASSDRSLDL